jgi:hypothetical protein
MCPTKTNWCRFLHDVLPDLSQSVQYQSQSGLHVQQRSVTNKSEAEMQHAVRQLVTKYGVDPAALASWRCMVTPRTESRKNRVKNYFSPNGVRCRSVVEIERHITVAAPSGSPAAAASAAAKGAVYAATAAAVSPATAALPPLRPSHLRRHPNLRRPSHLRRLPDLRRPSHLRRHHHNRSQPPVSMPATHRRCGHHGRALP